MVSFDAWRSAWCRCSLIIHGPTQTRCLRLYYGFYISKDFSSTQTPLSSQPVVKCSWKGRGLMFQSEWAGWVWKSADCVLLFFLFFHIRNTHFSQATQDQVVEWVLLGCSQRHGTRKVSDGQIYHFTESIVHIFVPYHLDVKLKSELILTAYLPWYWSLHLLGCH